MGLPTAAVVGVRDGVRWCATNEGSVYPSARVGDFVNGTRAPWQQQQQVWQVAATTAGATGAAAAAEAGVKTDEVAGETAQKAYGKGMGTTTIPGRANSNAEKA